MVKRCHVIGGFIAFLLLSCSAITYSQQNEPKAGQNLTKEIRHQLVLLPYYSVFDNLSYRVEGSKVVLSGQVVRASLKADAEAAVKSVEGVSSVQNDIEVLPPAPTSKAAGFDRRQRLFVCFNAIRVAPGHLLPLLAFRTQDSPHAGCKGQPW